MKQPSTGIPMHQLRRLAAITATAFALGASAPSALAQTYPAWKADTYYTAGTVVTYNGRLIEQLHVDFAQRILTMHEAILALEADA